MKKIHFFALRQSLIWGSFSVLLLAIFGISPVWALQSSESSTVGVGQIESLIRSGKQLVGVKLRDPKLMLDFYSKRQWAPAWNEGQKSKNKLIGDFLEQLELAARDGLNPENYHVSTLRSLIKDGDNTEAMLAELDVLLSDAALGFISDVSIGRVNVGKLYADWRFPQNKIDVAAQLEGVLRAKDIDDALQNLFPKTLAYVGLREALAYYQKIAKEGGWTVVPKVGKKWLKGESGAHIALLKKRLRVTGELSEKNSVDENLFDDNLEEAVKKFQQQYGLKPDGVVGIYTQDAAHKSVEEMISRIEINMERWRMLPRNMGGKFIFVNIADYRVQVIENDKVELSLNAVVGQPSWRTPVFQDEMETLVINPQWHVPPKIASKETLPKVKNDPSYLAKNGFKVFKNEEGHRVQVDSSSIDWSSAEANDFLFSQNSGDGNSLGRMKFLFPNSFSVYMHDTPSKSLFQNDVRAYSHGCMRIQSPIKLALFVMKGAKGDAWDEARINKIIDTGRETFETLPEKIPVYIYYLTAWASDDGKINFRYDIYNYDAKLAQALKR